MGVIILLDAYFEIIKNRPYLAWYVKDPERLSAESILEHILNYGDWGDVKKFIKIKGFEETAKLLHKTLKKKRSNYSPVIRYFFLVILIKKMFKNVLSEEQKRLLPLIRSFALDFYLVGGTALALQVAHRRSIDFDLLTSKPFESMKIRNKIVQNKESVNHVFFKGMMSILFLLIE